MNDIKITSLETVRKLDMARGLIVNISDACEYLGCCNLTNNEYADRISGIFGVIEYATTAAFWELDEYTDELMKVHGFVYPMHNPTNREIQAQLDEAERKGAEDGD